MRKSHFVAALAMVALAGRSAVAAPVAEDAFELRTTSDLVALCSADQGDRLYTAAQNFCHGFAVGTYRTLVAVDAGIRSKKKWFCEPTPAPSRTESIAAFVAWASSHSDMLALPPTDSVFKYFETADQCR